MTPILSDYWVSLRNFSAAEGAMCWAPATFGLGFGSLLTGKLVQRYGSNNEPPKAKICHSTHMDNRTERYLIYSKIGLVLSCASFLVMLIRWAFNEPMMWEIMYSFPAWIGMGMSLSSQFVALSAAKPDHNAATSVTTYYLLQQIGWMTGVTVSRASITKLIRYRLKVAFGTSVESRKVSRSL